MIYLKCAVKLIDNIAVIVYKIRAPKKRQGEHLILITNKPQFVKILSISLIAFIGILLISLGANIINSMVLASKEAKLKRELALLEQTANKNQTEIEYKQSSDYTDKYAKEYLDKSDEDEEVYVGVHEE